MKARAAIISTVLVLLALVPAARAQVTTITLSPDQIGVIKTAPGITTRITFPDKIVESVCGDLYDASTGKGAFVIQPSGNDLFLKPISSKGMSNLFVKSGESGKTYNFDLLIVQAEQAHRVVYVVDPASARPGPEAAYQPSETANHREAESRKSIIEDARKQADEILRNARQQADRLTAEAETRLADVDRLAAQRAQQEIERRFVQALMLGLREVKINNPRITARKVVVTLDPRVLTFNERAYLRYTIQNTGESEFAFGGVSLGTDSRSLTVELVQSKAQNRLEPGESMTGIIAFDAKLIGAKDRLTLFVRGEDNAEIARVSIP